MKTYTKFVELTEGYDISVDSSSIKDFTTKIDKKKLNKLLKLLKSSGTTPTKAPLDIYIAGDEKGNIKVRVKDLPSKTLKQIDALDIPFKFGNGTPSDEGGSGKKITDPVGGSPNSTYFYEQWQSIGLLGYLEDSDCDAVLNGEVTNKIIKKFKSAYKDGLGEIGKGPKEFPKALDYPPRLQDAAMLVKGSIKLYDEYKSYITGGTVVWGEIDKYYDLMKAQGPNLVKADEKQNTADAVVMKGISLSDLNKEDLVFEYFPGDNGVITVTQRKKKLGTILQVSMKKSHKDARLGKIKDVFTNKGFFGDTPADLLNRYVKESIDDNVEYSESLEEGILDFFKSAKAKLSSWAEKLKGSLNKLVTWVSKWFLSLIKKHFNPSKMQKSSEEKLNKYFSTLTESTNLLQEGKLNSADQMKYILKNKKEGQKIVNKIVKDMNNEVASVRSNIAAINTKAKNNKFLGTQAIDGYKTFKVKGYNASDFNTLRQYIMNYTSLETFANMTAKISSGTGTLDMMVSTFIDFMESAYMGNTTLPIIKLFGIKTGSEKAVEVVDKESFDKKRDEIIKRMKTEKIPCGGAAARIKKGEGFGVFYLYTIAGIKEDGEISYNNTRLTSYGQDLSYKIEAEREINLPTLNKQFPSGK